MPWTAIPAYVSGAVLTAANLNTYVKGNLEYHQAVFEGTAQASGSNFYPTSDTRFIMRERYGELGGGLIEFDTNDYLLFEANVNEYRFRVGGASKLVIDANGKLGGAGIYRSGEVSIGAGSTATFNHGLAGKPLIVTGLYGPSGNQQNPLVHSGTEVFVNVVTTTQFTVTNQTGGTQYVLAVAIL